MNSVGYHESMSFCVKINSKPVDCTKPKIAKRSYKLRWRKWESFAVHFSAGRQYLHHMTYNTANNRDYRKKVIFI